MNEIQLFSSPEFGEIRTLEIDGEPWFVGKDIADNLGYQNGSRDINRHVEEDDRRKMMVFDGNQDKETIIINESGVYALVFGSKLPTAKQFKHWVTSEVLPAIRKTGSYSAKQADPLKEKRLQIMERNATARQAKVMLEFAKMGLSQASIELLANGACEMMTGKRILPEPVVDETWTATQVGEMLGVSANKIGKISNANGLKCDKYGIRVLDTAKNGKQIPTFRYNKAGVERLRELVESSE